MVWDKMKRLVFHSLDCSSTARHSTESNKDVTGPVTVEDLDMMRFQPDGHQARFARRRIARALTSSSNDKETKELSQHGRHKKSFIFKNGKKNGYLQGQTRNVLPTRNGGADLSSYRSTPPNNRCVDGRQSPTPPARRSTRQVCTFKEVAAGHDVMDDENDQLFRKFQERVRQRRREQKLWTNGSLLVFLPELLAHSCEDIIEEQKRKEKHKEIALVAGSVSNAGRQKDGRHQRHNSVAYLAGLRDVLPFPGSKNKVPTGWIHAHRRTSSRQQQKQDHAQNDSSSSSVSPSLDRYQIQRPTPRKSPSLPGGMGGLVRSSTTTVIQADTRTDAAISHSTKSERRIRAIDSITSSFLFSIAKDNADEPSVNGSRGCSRSLQTAWQEIESSNLRGEGGACQMYMNRIDNINTSSASSRSGLTSKRSSLVTTASTAATSDRDSTILSAVSNSFSIHSESYLYNEISEFETTTTSTAAAMSLSVRGRDRGGILSAASNSFRSGRTRQLSGNCDLDSSSIHSESYLYNEISEFDTTTSSTADAAAMSLSDRESILSVAGEYTEDDVTSQGVMGRSHFDSRKECSSDPSDAGARTAHRRGSSPRISVSSLESMSSHQHNKRPNNFFLLQNQYDSDEGSLSDGAQSEGSGLSVDFPSTVQRSGTQSLASAGPAGASYRSRRSFVARTLARISLRKCKASSSPQLQGRKHLSSDLYMIASERPFLNHQNSDQDVGEDDPLMPAI
jgi:hypothetical protein